MGNRGPEGGNLRVRELWVGNLPANITEKKLYSHFFIFGEIEKIDIVDSNNNSNNGGGRESYHHHGGRQSSSSSSSGAPFAFIRYKLVSCTSRAFD